MIDRELRLGLRALHEGIVGPDQLCEAMDECLHRNGLALSTILEERGWVSPAQLADLARREAEAPTDLVKNIDSRGEPGPTAVYSPGDDVPTLNSPPSTVVSPSANGRTTAGWDRYERIRLHAIGGLGRVWLARDTHLGREVALKELRVERAKECDPIGRFVDEARITSQIEHPGIVPVYDMIEHDATTGLPFYTMRFLAGRTLSGAVEAYHGRRKEGKAERLEFRGLLDAFTAVCQAVAFAHSKGVLHRDLKGMNVILGNFGEVFVIDWGLAKASKAEGQIIGRFDPGSGPGLGNHDETAPGSILGTPGYIAPELLDSKPADRRSDVYSLGSILYLILVGRAAYSGESNQSIIQLVRDREPERPRSLVPEVPRALEAVCLKAMARDPSHRYQSAVELADEVRRWLADEPVGALPDSAVDRLARWGRKNRAAVVAALVTLASVSVVLAISTVSLWEEQRRTAQQRDEKRVENMRAESNLNLARQLSADVLKIAEEKLTPIRGTERVRAEIYDASLGTFRNFLGQRPEDPFLLRWTARIDRNSANVHRLLNESDVAEASYTESIALFESLAKRFPDELQHRVDLAMVLGDYATAVARVGRLRKAADLSHRALDVAEPLKTAFPDRIEPRRALGKTLNDLALIEAQMGNHAESARLGSRATGIYEEIRALTRDRKSLQDTLMLGSCLNVVAVADRELGKVEESRAAVDRGFALMSSQLEELPRNNDATHFLAKFLLERARLSSGIVERREQVLSDLVRAIALWDELAEGYPLYAIYTETAAVAHQVRGALPADLESSDQAGEDLDASRRALEPLVEKFPRNPSYRTNLGQTYLEQGRLARRLGQADPARKYFDRAIEKLKAVLDATPELGRARTLYDQAVGERSRLVEAGP